MALDRDVRTVRSEDRRRAYVRAHPVALWLSVGFAVAGAIQALDSSLAGQSAAELALPHWLHVLYGLVYSVGGFLSAFGIARYRRNLEAAGMAMMASGLVVQFLSIIYVLPGSALAAIFLPTLAIGFALRVRYLINVGQR
jgi:hypothetical protein